MKETTATATFQTGLRRAMNVWAVPTAGTIKRQKLNELKKRYSTILKYIRYECTGLVTSPQSNSIENGAVLMMSLFPSEWSCNDRFITHSLWCNWIWLIHYYIGIIFSPKSTCVKRSKSVRGAVLEHSFKHTFHVCLRAFADWNTRCTGTHSYVLGDICAVLSFSA